MPPSPRYTVRLPSVLDAQVQAHLQATGTPFAVFLREVLSAYFANITPTGMLTPADTNADTAPETTPTGADTLRHLQEQLSAVTTRLDILEQALTRRRPRADSSLTAADRSADRMLTPADTATQSADCPPFDATKNRLGRLCPRGHEWGHTGQSLLRVSNQRCRQCDNDRKRERRAAQRQPPP